MALFLSAYDRVEFNNASIYPARAESVRLTGLLAKPAGSGLFPAVVLLHSCGGITSHVTHYWPNFLNDLGYATLTIDSFGSRGLGRCPNEMDRGEGLKGNTGTYKRMVQDAYGALDYLATRPDIDAQRVAVMGFSIGGFAINMAMVMQRLRMDEGTNFKAAIAFYAHCKGLFDYDDDMMMPLMQIAAENDQIGKTCMGFYGNPMEVHVLKGAYHAFDSPEADGREDVAGHYMRYDEDATKKAGEFTKAFLAKHLGKLSR